MSKMKKWMIIGVLALPIIIFFSLKFGAANTSWSTYLNILGGFINKGNSYEIIINMRLPRILATGIVGASFAVAGAAMQGLTRNKLADASILGINSGASFMLAICFALISRNNFIITIIMSFIGAALGLFLTLSFSTNKYSSNSKNLLLAGVAVSLFFTSLSQFVAIYFNIGQELTFWNVGGNANIGYSELMLSFIAFVIGILILFSLAKKLTLLSISDEVATSLGVNVNKTKFLICIGALLLAGMSVSIVGSISFVGLIVPYAVSRLIKKEEYQYILPLSCIYGANFLIIIDLIARNIQPPYETPLGIIMSIIGVPTFLFMERKMYYANK
ncbi:FecCD family ABC transporter permease [Mycoplasma sp. P36-A1]|uniref:FecCD family ABC transporter permease n=1 Tax=Mycoplasma sp. P36-A1 TaxID=3252900 RepID=UPI003C2F582F